VTAVKYVLACIPDDPAVRAEISRVVGKDCVPYKDSVPGVCEVCGCKVWLGPEQEAKRKKLADYERGDVIVMCEPCAVLVMQAGPTRKVQPLSQKQWGE
jgi:hypothetical protein